MGIIRHCPPLLVIYRLPLKTSRSEYSRCGASSRIKVRYGATKVHSSSLTSLGYGFLFMTAAYHAHPSKCITASSCGLCAFVVDSRSDV